MGIVTTYGLAGLGFERWHRQEILSSPTRPRRLWDQPSHLFNIAGFTAGRDLATYLHLVPRLSMSRAVSLLLLYAFIAWTGTAAESNLA